jgi:hypothetical protein
MLASNVPAKFNTTANDEFRDTELPAIQQRAVFMIATGISRKAIAAELGVNEFTIARWQREPKFIKALNDTLQYSAQSARAQMPCLATKAISIIARVMEGKDVPEKVKLETAFRLLELTNGSGQNRGNRDSMAALFESFANLPDVDSVGMTQVSQASVSFEQRR